VVSDVRDYDTTGTGYVPDIESSQDAAYSAYQAAIIAFTDPDTPTVGLVVGESQREYAAAVRVMAYIKEIQDFVGRRDIVNPNGDHVVRAAVPCFVTINLHVADATADDVDAIRNAIMHYVNSLGFVPALYGSRIVAAVYAELGTTFKLSALDMLGRIRGTNGEIHFVHDRDVLYLPDMPEAGITHRTACFITGVESIGVTVI